MTKKTISLLTVTYYRY